ncbi:MAG: ATP-binding protein [Humidesulfovibrio sp.]|nr:ATP-binding protein [Humidesulfovibrio sp.]
MRLSPPLLLMAKGRFRLLQWGVALVALLLALLFGAMARELGSRAERNGLLLTLQAMEARLALVSSSMAEAVFLSRHGVNPSVQPLTRVSLERLFRPIVGRLRFIDSAVVTRGSDVLLYLRKSQDRVESLPPSRAAFAVGMVQPLSAGPVLSPATDEGLLAPQGFDVRGRSGGDLVWSSTPAGAEPGQVFASLRLPDDNGRPLVVSFGIELSSLDSPFTALAGREAGVTIFGYGDKVVGSLDQQGFHPARDGVLDAAAGAMAEAFARSGNSYLEVVEFSWKGERWRGVFDKLTLIDRASFIGFAVPRGKAQAGIGSGANLLWGLAAVCLAAGAVGLWLVSLLRKRLRSGLLTIGLDRQLSADDVYAFLRAGEREDIEFKSTLRTNLYSGKSDKRIELACLKTIAAFLNSKGGVLLVGVEDTGAVLGTEADGFPSKDRLLLHFVNLFNQHIGAEYARFVSAQAVTIEENVVLAITCQKAETPVIVTNGEEEHYYVRVGPATGELKMSQVVALLRK